MSVRGLSDSVKYALIPLLARYGLDMNAPSGKIAMASPGVCNFGARRCTTMRTEHFRARIAQVGNVSSANSPTHIGNLSFPFQPKAELAGITPAMWVLLGVEYYKSGYPLNSYANGAETTFDWSPSSTINGTTGKFMSIFTDYGADLTQADSAGRGLLKKKIISQNAKTLRKTCFFLQFFIQKSYFLHSNISKNSF